MTRRITPDLRNKAIGLRKLGLSYSEICKQVHVAKSTLSSLLKNLELSEKAKKIIESKTVGAQKLGAEAKRSQRIEKVERIRKSAISQVTNITDKELFLMGIMLYWAEGSKAREDNISQSVAFTNSDLFMSRLLLKWLRNCLGIKNQDIILAIYVHDLYRGQDNEIMDYWSKEINIPKKNFRKISFTKTRFSKKNRRLNRANYHGQLRIVVRKSTDLNRKISGWIEGICLQSGVA